MTHLPTYRPEEVLRNLRRIGFAIDHVTGSHYILRRSDGQRVVVPYHRGRDIKRGTLHAILQQAGLTAEEFRDL